jgi:hypothetical protein
MGSPEVAIGRQALAAYGSVALRMFQPALEGVRAAELSPGIGSSGVDLDREGWFAFVEHDLVLRDVAGAEVARWRVRGQGRIVGLGESAIPTAFAEAASVAARTFEADFERPSAVAVWLASQGLERSSAVAGLAQRFTPASPRVVPPRAERLIFAEFGASAVGASGWISSALGARAGWSGQPWFMQLAIDAWPREFVAQPPGAWGQAHGHAVVLSTGLDAGVQKRLGSHFEVGGGVGVAILSGFGSTEYVPLSAPTSSVGASDQAAGGSVSAFAVARLYGVVPLLAFRYRLALEVRKAFGTRLSFDALGQTVDSSGLWASVLLGFEVPWQRGPGR